MKKSIFLKVLAAAISILLLFSVVPSTLLSGLAVTPEQLTIGLMTDIHYYPRSLMGSDINEFIDACHLNSNTAYLTDEFLNAALENFELQAQNQGLKYILIPGDLSRNGEYESNKVLAKKLEDFENRTGVQILVIDGNHDIRKPNASKFQNGQFVNTRWTEPEDFRELYKNLGYDLADSFYTPKMGEAGQLSYAATLDGGYRLIALDGACYSSEVHSKGLNEGETRGAFTDGLLEWALNEIEKAKAQGLTVIGMTHFNIVEHYDHEDNTMQAFVIDNWQEVCEKLADAGMHFTFTGHLHFHDIAQWTSDNGETMTDCATASLSTFPNFFRTVTLDNTAADGSVTVNYTTHEIDELRPISAHGTTYPQPFKYTSFALNYGGDDIADFGVRYVKYFFTQSIIPGIKESGSLYNYLDKSFNLDKVIGDLLANTNLGQAQGVTKTAIKLLLKTVASQLEAKYIDNPENAYNLVEKILKKLVSVEVSDYPCTKYLENYGVGSADRKGNFGDAVSSVLLYMYSGDEDRSDDQFMNDVLDRFYRGENAQEIYDTLYDIVVNDVLKAELLPTIQVDPVAFFGALTEEAKIDALNSIMDTVMGVSGAIPKLDAGTIVSLVLGLGITDYNSIEGLLDSFLDEYMTDSEMEVIAYEFYNFIYDFTTDELPHDLNETVVYNGTVPVTPTVEDLRLPSGVAVTFGSDASTSRNICWYTKVGVKNTDIEITPDGESRLLRKSRSASTINIETKTERTTREYPGIDLGVFGILNYTLPVNRHYVTISGLEPGKRYVYRVGDAQRDWWSDYGIIETADNGDEFTFLHMSDEQGGIERQYDVWANTVKSAYNTNPEAAFIMSSGDQVDKGTNFKQWNWLFNCASDNLMDTVLMPTAGNHEKTGSALTDNFILSDLPVQDKDNGVYYSFDYNNAHFIVLNTNDLNDDGTLTEDQLAWLKQDAASSNADWKIVSIHKGVYSNGNHVDDKDVSGLRGQLSTLMPELGIDLVLEGHDHVYLRTDAMSNNEVIKPLNANVTHNAIQYNAKVKPAGTIYAESGTAGVKQYDKKDPASTDELFPRAEVIYNTDKPMYSAIQIKGDRLFFDAYTVDGDSTTKADSFAIAKTITPMEAQANNITDASVISADSTGGRAEDGSNNGSGSKVTGSPHSPKTAGISLNANALIIPGGALAVAAAIIIIKKKREDFYYA
jgi:3',5'-cyclic AMP phosphodiesterase CpdA